MFGMIVTMVSFFYLLTILNKGIFSFDASILL